MLLFRASKDGEHLELKEMNFEHNHEVNKVRIFY